MQRGSALFSSGFSFIGDVSAGNETLPFVTSAAGISLGPAADLRRLEGRRSVWEWVHRQHLRVCSSTDLLWQREEDVCSLANGGKEDLKPISVQVD